VTPKPRLPRSRAPWRRTDAQRSQALAEIGLALAEAWRVTGPDGVAPIVDCVVAFAQAGDRERARSTLREAGERIAREDGPATAPRLLALAREETRLGVPGLAVEALTALLLGPPPGAGWDAGVAEALADLSEMFEAAGRESRAAELRTSATRLALGLPSGKIRVQALAGLIPIIALSEPGAGLDGIVTAAVGDFTGSLGADRDERDLDAANERLRSGQPLREALLEIGSAEASRVDLGWEDPEERQWALMRRAERLAMRGRFLDAEQKARELEDPESGCWAWSAIGSARLRFGDLDGAERAWDQAQEVARQIPELSARVRNLTQLAETQLDAGCTDLARAVLTEASEALRLEAEHPPERPQSQSLRLAAEVTALERSGLPLSQLSTRLAELAAAARAISPRIRSGDDQGSHVHRRRTGPRRPGNGRGYHAGWPAHRTGRGGAGELAGRGLQHASGRTDRGGDGSC
jgi:tetratricopeptide (TPR) repeat protein